jgi:hypothetical protein
MDRRVSEGCPVPTVLTVGRSGERRVAYVVPVMAGGHDGGPPHDVLRPDVFDLTDPGAVTTSVGAQLSSRSTQGISREEEGWYAVAVTASRMWSRSASKMRDSGAQGRGAAGTS